jgi:hypothetical protein
MHTPARTLIATALLALGGAAGAGTVEVAFVNPSNYTDAGNAVWEERQNLDALARHLESLGRRMLPSDAALKVELLDVDLAGTLELRGTNPTRIVRGRTDFPRIQLRYSLSAPGQPVRTADEDVRDIDYARGPRSTRRDQPLYYEKRMLERWFTQRFGTPH